MKEESRIKAYPMQSQIRAGFIRSIATSEVGLQGGFPERRRSAKNEITIIKANGRRQTGGKKEIN